MLSVPEDDIPKEDCEDMKNKPEMDQAIRLKESLVAKARESLFEYICVAAADYTPAPFHVHVCDLLTQSEEEGACRRLILAAPPRHGKSRLVAKEFGAWYAGRHPDRHVVVVSYSGGVSRDSTRFIRNRLHSDLSRYIFPKSGPLNPNASPSEFHLEGGGTVRAASIQGQLTGMPADLLIVDDVYKGRDDADSRVYRDRVWDWFVTVAMTRLSPEGTVCIINTRWHPDDLIGRLTNVEYQQSLIDAGVPESIFENHRFPAICDVPEGDEDELGRRAGEALWPERWTEKIIRARYAELGAYEARALYDQLPMLRSGNETDVTKLVYVDSKHIPPDMELVRGWDIAVTASNDSDFSAGVRGGYDEKTDTFWIVHIHHMQKRWGEVKRAIGGYGDIEPGRIRVEAVGQAQGLFDEVKADRLGKNIVSCATPTSSKMNRAAPWLAMIDAGKVRIVRGPWNAKFVSELMEFPAGAHDDQVDAVSIVWEMVKKKSTRLFFD